MTLSEFSYYARKLGPIAVLGFILFIILFLILGIIIRIIMEWLTPPPPPFSPAFGKLEPITYSQKIDYPPNYEFVLDNILGRPIVASESATIYPVFPSTSSFGYPETLSFMARTVGFDTDVTPYDLVDTKATFENFEQKLEVDITNYNFTYESKFEDKPQFFENTIIPDSNKIREAAKTFLRQMNRYPEDFAKGDERVIYLYFDDIENKLKVVEDPSRANVVEVSYMPPPTEAIFPLLPPTFYKSQNYVIMVFKPEGNTIIKAQVRHFPIDIQGGSPYPLKTGDQAWKELIEGKAAIVSAGQNTNQITVRDMFLGYYYPETYQPYIQPVFVFIGDNNFAAYVDAVDDKYIEGKDEKTSTTE